MQAILLYFSDFVTKYYWMFLYNLVIIAKIQNHEKHANIKAFSWFVKNLIQPTSVEEHESFAKEWYRTKYSLPLIVKSKTNPNADSIDPKTKFKLIFM